jgi:hypothetical protein
MLLIKLLNLIRMIFFKKYKFFLSNLANLFLIIVGIIWSDFKGPDTFCFLIATLINFLVSIAPDVNILLYNYTIIVGLKLVFFFIFCNVSNQFLILYYNLINFFFKTIIYLILNLFFNLLDNLHWPLNFKDFILFQPD